MKARTQRFVRLALLGFLLGSCSADVGSEDCSIGTERCACTSGNACDPGLTCLSGRCVRSHEGAGGTGTARPEYEIHLESGLGGAPGACTLNWCRFGTCHMMCLVVPDDEASCDAAADAYAGIPSQNFLSVRFIEDSTCQRWSSGNVRCVDEFGVLYVPIDDTCNEGDELAERDGACHYSFCSTGDHCVEGCERTDEAGCASTDRILREADGRVSSWTRYEESGTCPPAYSGSGGAAGTGGASSSGGTGGESGDSRCSECLSACSGLGISSCCTGTGCLCEQACQPTSCTPPRVLCCRTSPCMCLERC